MQGTVDGTKKSSDTAAKYLKEVAGTEVQIDNGSKVTQQRGQSGMDGNSPKKSGMGPMDKYVTAPTRRRSE